MLKFASADFVMFLSVFNVCVLFKKYGGRMNLKCGIKVMRVLRSWLKCMFGMLLFSGNFSVAFVVFSSVDSSARILFLFLSILGGMSMSLLNS